MHNLRTAVQRTLYCAVLVERHHRIRLDVPSICNRPLCGEAEGNKRILLLYAIYDSLNDGTVQAILLAEYNHGTLIPVDELFEFGFGGDSLTHRFLYW